MLTLRFVLAGIRARRLHHECGPAQNEIEYHLAESSKNADDAVLGMWITRLLASEFGWKALFNPKPFEQEAGSGLHQHMYLFRLSDKKNAFREEGKTNVLNAVGRNFSCGMVKYAKDITAIFAHDPETFRRLRPGYEAPVYAGWDYQNRTALVRVPHISIGGEEKTRVEFRAGDATGSIHLLCAALLAAGVRGIEEKLDMPNAPLNFEHATPEEQARYKIELLPTSMEQCLKILHESAFCADLLGADAVRKLVELRQPGGHHHDEH